MPPDLNSLPSSPNMAATSFAGNGNGHAHGNGNGNGHINGNAQSSTRGATGASSTRGNSSANAIYDGLAPGLSSGAKQPNILYIMADQMSAPHLKMYNPDSQIKTPHLDKLAEKSVLFDSAYCPSPLCAPSRMSMISGQLPMKIGAYDNASQIPSDTMTYAHYLRLQGYLTALAGKMHFVGDQLHGYEKRLTSDIYPGDFGWCVNWDKPDTRLEWYHNSSSILQAGVCVSSNQMDYDEEVMYESVKFLKSHSRSSDKRPFCLTVSLTHPHDPYTIDKERWDRYEGVDIDLPKVRIAEEDQDPHSKRLLNVCDLKGQDFSDEQIKKARRAYYGSCSYVDDNIGKLLKTVDDLGLSDDTIIVFSGDHGDMLGERNLWYKMSYFEGSVRVPMLISYPKWFTPHHVKENVSTLDILPTMCDLVGTKPYSFLPMDGLTMMPHLLGQEGGHDTVIAEYTGEGTIAPLMMIRRGPWKYITCPTDGSQLFNLDNDPYELNDLAKSVGRRANLNAEDQKVRDVFLAFEAEANERWDFDKITQKVILSQRQRHVVWEALKIGDFDSWDYNPPRDGRKEYIRSDMDLDDLERRARYPPVDTHGNATSTLIGPQAGSHGE